MTFVRAEEVDDDWGRGFAAAKAADKALLDAAAAHICEMEAEVHRLRAAVVKLQVPEGEREERVAEWLRSRGYVVTGGTVEQSPRPEGDTQ